MWTLSTRVGRLINWAATMSPQNCGILFFVKPKIKTFLLQTPHSCCHRLSNNCCHKTKRLTCHSKILVKQTRLTVLYFSPIATLFKELLQRRPNWEHDLNHFLPLQPTPQCPPNALNNTVLPPLPSPPPRDKHKRGVVDVCSYQRAESSRLKQRDILYGQTNYMLWPTFHFLIRARNMSVTYTTISGGR